MNNVNFPFRNRSEAGKTLVSALESFRDWPNLLILALPRGGVPVGFEIAKAFKVPLDILVVRKLGVPGHPELAMGAIASGGIIIRNQEIIDRLKISEAMLQEISLLEEVELKRRELAYRGSLAAKTILRMNVILVDDGLATGASLRAAIQATRAQNPQSITSAVPVGAKDSCEEMLAFADTVICAYTPDPFYSVGGWYHDFAQVTDEEVRKILNKVSAGIKY